MTQEFNTKIYRTHKGIKVAQLVFSLIFTVVIINVMLKPQNGEGNILFGFGVILAIGFIRGLFGAVKSITSDKPRLTLTPEGIRNEVGLKNDFFSWKDIGPVYLAYRRKGPQFLYAYSDHTNDILVRAGKNPQPDPKYAEIIMNIKYIADLPHEEKAQDAVKVINEWREKFGAPAIEQRRYKSEEITDLKEIEELERKLEEVRKRNWFKGILIFLGRILKVIITLSIVLTILAFGAPIHEFVLGLL